MCVCVCVCVCVCEESESSKKHGKQHRDGNKVSARPEHSSERDSEHGPEEHVGASTIQINKTCDGNQKTKKVCYYYEHNQCNLVEGVVTVLMHTQSCVTSSKLNVEGLSPYILKVTLRNNSNWIYYNTFSNRITPHRKYKRNWNKNRKLHTFQNRQMQPKTKWWRHHIPYVKNHPAPKVLFSESNS